MSRLSESGRSDARVWAPDAEQVALHRVRAGAAERVELTRADGGWWVAIEALEAGDRYGFLIDGDEHPLPDPRSRRQPDGVHGLSAPDDPADVDWLDDNWHGRQLAGGVIYELHIGTYSPEGTFDGAIARLDHLVELGVDFVELLPVNGFNGEHNWGYDGVAWFAVHEAYGGPAGYRRFVDACHTRGLAVIQDVVYNHLGPSGNYLPRFGPYLHSGSANTWGDSVNLGDREVRRFVLDNLAMWFEDFHVDGLRLDAVHALVDESPTHILQAMSEETDARSAHLGRPLTLIAESDMNDPRLILPREAGGYGLTAQWSDDHHHAIHAAVTGESDGYYADFATADALPKTSTKGFFHDGTHSSFRDRPHGFPIPAEVPTWRLVTFAQDHDQIGNRAAGDRISQTLAADEIAVAAVLNLTSPFTPMLFMGEEWGATTPWQFFTSHPEPELGLATAEGRLAEFAKMGWDESVVPDPQARATFERSKLAWSEVDEPRHARLLALHRALIRLRKHLPELTDPRFEHTLAAGEGEDGLAVFRLDRGAGIQSPHGGIVSVCAAIREEASFEVGSEAALELSTTPDATLVDGVLTLPARSAAVVRVRAARGV
ncbi:malto-oligosyltrehalose trehalohydrolase [Microcella alkalica]|uniref:Malto-oligosyltrehalose trehalohydrolase n=1 Tax=Microcella alkalica TaxID=355930 RepID=A0A839E741_9MICO|nr:malto-oligosyltrehalose trehalohydrolase [Microcella alkalica]MBA8848479.1 maltooligosyltrehalose trehalohydrolase [Microcella alkalica]